MIRLVKTKTPAATNETIANVPLNTSEKYNPTKTAAIKSRANLSDDPIFFLIVVLFILKANCSIFNGI